MTTADATVASLIAHGIDTIYALPGVHNDDLFEALFQASGKHAGFAAWTLLFYALWHRAHVLGLPAAGDAFDCLAATPRGA